MNETSEQLVSATFEALASQKIRTIAPDLGEVAKVAVIAVLRELRKLMTQDELDALAGEVADGDWPDADDLFILANDVEASL